jgi:hypothetical protein
MATLAAAVGEDAGLGGAVGTLGLMGASAAHPAIEAASTVSGRRSRRRLLHDGSGTLSFAPGWAQTMEPALQAPLPPFASGVTYSRPASTSSAGRKAAPSHRAFTKGGSARRLHARAGGGSSVAGSDVSSSAVSTQPLGSPPAQTPQQRKRTVRLTREYSVDGASDPPEQQLPVAQAAASLAVLESDPESGATLLHLAAEAGSAHLVATLLQAGADASARDAAGLNPRDLAVAALARVGSTAGSRWAATLRAFDLMASLSMEAGVLATPLPSPSRVGQSTLFDSVAGAGAIPASGLSLSDRRMLVDAFTALSLRDKCAVSLALGTASATGPPVPTGGNIAATSPAQQTAFGSQLHTLSRVGVPVADALSSPALHIATRGGLDRSALQVVAAEDSDALLLREPLVDPPQQAIHSSQAHLLPGPDTKRKRDPSPDPSSAAILSGDAVAPGPPLPHASPSASAVTDAGAPVNVLTSETQSVAHALALMSDEEVQDCKAEAQRIQANVRAWLVRRHFHQIRQATRTVQAAIRRTLARRKGIAMPESASSGGRVASIAAVDGAGGSSASSVSSVRSHGYAQATAPPFLHQQGGSTGGGSSRSLLLTRDRMPVIPEETRERTSNGASLAGPEFRSLATATLHAPLDAYLAQRPISTVESSGADDAPMLFDRPAAVAVSTASSGAATASALRSLQKSRKQAAAAAVIARSLRRWYAQPEAPHAGVSGPSSGGVG